MLLTIFVLKRYKKMLTMIKCIDTIQMYRNNTKFRGGKNVRV